MKMWILLRGLTRDSRHWDEFPRALGAALGAADVVTLDLPGNGTLHGERSPASVDGMVDAYRAALCARGLAPPYAVLALSLGAMVALAWATRFPQELSGLVLINTSTAATSRWHERLRWQSLPRLLAVALSRRPERQEQAILALTSRQPSVERDALLGPWTRWRCERPVTTANLVRQLWAAARFRAPERKPDVAMLLLASLGDELVDPRCSQQLARRWNVELRLLPSAGHDLPLDAADWVIAQVAEWHATSRGRGRSVSVGRQPSRRKCRR